MIKLTNNFKPQSGADISPDGLARSFDALRHVSLQKVEERAKQGLLTTQVSNNGYVLVLGRKVFFALNFVIDGDQMTPGRLEGIGILQRQFFAIFN